MNWKVKSKIQNAVSIFPSSFSYETYYWLQRHFGGLRRVNPVKKLAAAVEICKQISNQGESILNKNFFELGTGREPIVPIGFWLMGAEKTVTIDLNPYLKLKLIAESLHYISNNQNEILSLFEGFVDRKRFDCLLTLSRKVKLSLPSILDLCRIEYIAPGDAANTKLLDDSIDFYTSYNVLEHIPLPALEKIFIEGNRIIKKKGLFIHRIDYSDHFSHSDNSISSVNFLQYSDKEWGSFVGNKYMYMNRLRHDDFINLFNSSRQHIIETEPDKDKRVYDLLNNEIFQLNERFNSKSKDVLSITGSWIISQRA